jgi:hypothetical protein
MVRAFLKEADEILEDEEMFGVRRTIFDFIRTRSRPSSAMTPASAWTAGAPNCRKCGRRLVVPAGCQVGRASLTG